MAGDDFKKNFDDMLNKQKQINAGAKKLEESLAKQLEMQQDILSIKRDIHNTQGAINKLKEELEEQLKKEKELQKQIDEEKKKGTRTDKKVLENLKKELIATQKLKIEKGEKIKLGEYELEQQKEGLANMQAMVKESNKLKSIANSTKNFAKAWGWDKLKTYGVFEMDKEIRNAARSMGVGGSNFSDFAKNMRDAGGSTQAIGVSVGKLAQMQRGYSEEIGRSVALTEKGFVAMAELAEGTGLSEQFAIGMASAMDDFGANIGTSRDLIEETMNTADSMGVNSAKAAESMQKNLKFAQKYNFKNGVKGLSKMTSEALKLKLDLDGIAGLADKVFRPEGAIELSAKLSTMGGAFAQMANPMQLMFKARNDFAGFAKDIGKATAEFVEYNKETGTFDIKGGLANDRMREIANMTGLGVEELRKMAVQQQKIKMIGSVSPIDIPKKDMDFVESMAQIGKDGEITINTGKGIKDLKDLTKEDLGIIKARKKTLDERAKQSRTAVEILDDLLQSFQALLLPLAEGLQKGLSPLQEMMKDFNKDNGFYDSIRTFSEGVSLFVGDKLSGFIKVVGGFVKQAGPGGTLAAIMGLKAATWVLRGMSLGRGFNMVANAGGVGGSSVGTAGGVMSKADRKFARSQIFSKGGGSFRDRLGYAKMGLSGPKMSTGARMGAGLGLGLGGMALDYGRSQMDDQYSTGGKMMGIGSSALKGAALGMLLGPIGAAVGGGLGALYGAYQEYGSEEARERDRRRAGTKRFGTPVNDGIIKFHPNDKFMQMNDGAILASTQEGQLHKAAKELSGGGDVNHKFDDIKINININATGIDNDIAKKITDNKSFIRSLNTKIKEEAAMVLSGGILSPTPK